MFQMESVGRGKLRGVAEIVIALQEQPKSHRERASAASGQCASSPKWLSLLTVTESAGDSPQSFVGGGAAV
jgi:hypothetical protein